MSFASLCHVVVDLETLGRKPGCPILEIGAAAQIGGNIILPFSAHPNLQEQHQAGMVADPATVLWWMKNDETMVKAREHQFQGHGLEGESGEPVCKALMDFSAFLSLVGEACEVRIWGNSARFDLGILEELYHRFHIEVPWKFWEERDLRTVFELLEPEHAIVRDFDKMPYHTGLGDASYELSRLLLALRRLDDMNNGFTAVPVPE